MHAPAIVEAFDPVDDVEPGLRTAVIAKQMVRSTLSVLKKLAIAALTLLCQVSRAESAMSARISGYRALTMYRFRHR
jgi:hypothetical protein